MSIASDTGIIEAPLDEGAASKNAVTETQASENLDHPDKLDRHPALSLRDSFHFLKDEYRLKSEPDIDIAFESYLEKVDLAFQNVWPLHPNTGSERSHDQLLEAAFDLDFRNGEMRRIRSILPADEDAFDLIDILGQKILFENLDIYLENRREAFIKLRRIPALIASLVLFLIFFVIGLLFLAKMSHLIEFTNGSVLYILVGSIFAGSVAFIFLIARLAVGVEFWKRWITKELLHRRTQYESSVRDATGLVSGCLSQLAHEIKERVQELKNRLDRMGKSEDGRNERAPEFVRLLLWFPERLGLIENYYRARIDLFVKRSAERILESDARVDRYLKGRQSFIFGVIFGFVVHCGNIVLPSFSVMNYGNFSVSALIALGLVVGGALLMKRPIRMDHSALRFAPKYLRENLHSIAFARGVGLVAAGVIIFLLSFSAPAGRVLACQFDNGGLALVPMALVGLIAGALVGTALFQQNIARRIYLGEYRKKLSANVTHVVVKKMENSTWNAYSSVRVDRKIAEVYAAIYSELTEWKRARIQQGG